MVFERFWSEIGYVFHSIWLGTGKFVYHETFFCRINFVARAAYTPQIRLCGTPPHPPDKGGGVNVNLGL